MKRAFVVQSVGHPGDETRARADRVWESLIEPACREAGYEAVRADRLAAGTITEPIISSLFTDPLVIADLGAPPWNANVMLEVGFRLGVGRSTVFLADKPLSDDALPFHLRNRRVVEIDPGAPQGARGTLIDYIDGCRSEGTQGWSSQYAYVDFRVPAADPSKATYTYANDAAAKMYGLENAEALIGKPVDEIDTKLLTFMADRHRQEFVAEQSRVFGDILTGGRKMTASVEIPLWFTNHTIKDEQNQVYLPLLVHHKYDEREGVYLMRTMYVNITGWAAEDVQGRAVTDVLKIPQMFRRSRQFDNDVFLPCDSRDSEYVSDIRYMLERWECSVWYRPEAERAPPEDLVRALSRSRMLALVVGRAGLGRWESREKVRTALLEYCRRKNPHVLLLLPEIQAGGDRPWEPYVPEPYRPFFAESLYLELPQPGELLPPPPGRTTFLERIIRELLKVLRKIDDASMGNAP
jgi:hypothetical protein